MEFWLNISLLMLKTILLAFLNPFFGLFIIIVFMQYRRQALLEKKLFGIPFNNIWVQTFHSFLFGMVGGIFGSFFLLLLGISLESIGITYLWPLAIFLLLINPRYLCFAYAGGIISAVSLGVRFLLPFWPQLEEIAFFRGLTAIHLPGLLALIGILHLTESFLIFISGHLGSSPIYLKSPSGELLGGYSMQRFWPLPLMGLLGLVVSESSEIFVGGVSMPEWWPLLGTVLNPHPDEKLVYLTVPLVAVLGYSDLAVSALPRFKRIKTARNLALYSLFLTLLALSAVYYPAMLLPAALTAPLGHEFLIIKGNRDEFSKKPLFRADHARGLKVLAVVPNSPADKAGLKPADLLLEINSHPVETEADFWSILRLNYYRILLKIERGGRKMSLPLKIYPLPVNKVGLIFAPGWAVSVYLEMKESSLWRNIRRRFLRRRF